MTNPMLLFRRELLGGVFPSWAEVRREAYLLGLYTLEEWLPEEGHVLHVVGLEGRLAALDLNGEVLEVAPEEAWRAEPLDEVMG